jgi:hypothetical protein
MKTLVNYGRPYIAFDVTNPQHRQYFTDYTHTHSWAACPYRFELENGFTDVVSMIKSQVLDYYLNIEEQQKISQLT